MKKLISILLLSFFANFANAEVIATIGKQIDIDSEDTYEGYQIGLVKPLSEFDVSLSLTDIDDGLILTVGAQKGVEIFPSTMLYGFIDINRFFWDDDHHGCNCKTQLGYGLGVSFAFLEPIIIDVRYKKYEDIDHDYGYVGLAFMF